MRFSEGTSSVVYNFKSPPKPRHHGHRRARAASASTYHSLSADTSEDDARERRRGQGHKRRRGRRSTSASSRSSTPSISSDSSSDRSRSRRPHRRNRRRSYSGYSSASSDSSASSRRSRRRRNSSDSRRGRTSKGHRVSTTHDTMSFYMYMADWRTHCTLVTDRTHSQCESLVTHIPQLPHRYVIAFAISHRTFAYSLHVYIRCFRSESALRSLSRSNTHTTFRFRFKKHLHPATHPQTNQCSILHMLERDSDRRRSAVRAVPGAIPNGTADWREHHAVPRPGILLAAHVCNERQMTSVCMGQRGICAEAKGIEQHIIAKEEGVDTRELKRLLPLALDSALDGGTGIPPALTKRNNKYRLAVSKKTAAPKLSNKAKARRMASKDIRTAVSFACIPYACS